MSVCATHRAGRTCEGVDRALIKKKRHFLYRINLFGLCRFSILLNCIFRARPTEKVMAWCCGAEENVTFSLFSLSC